MLHGRQPTRQSRVALTRTHKAERATDMLDALIKERESTRASPSAPLFSIEQARNLIEDLSRKPFMDLLALFLGSHPTPQALLDFANRNPDRWSQATAVFSKLSGYNETLDINVSVMAQVKVLSDMDLENALRTINSQIGDSALVDHSVVEAPIKVSSIQKRRPKSPEQQATFNKFRKGRSIPKPHQSSL